MATIARVAEEQRNRLSDETFSQLLKHFFERLQSERFKPWNLLSEHVESHFSSVDSFHVNDWNSAIRSILRSNADNLHPGFCIHFIAVDESPPYEFLGMAAHNIEELEVFLNIEA